MFEHLLESTTSREAKVKNPFLMSLALHAVLLAVLAAIPLIYYHDLPSLELLTMLASPPPAPPPPPLMPPQTPESPVEPQVQVISLPLLNLEEIPEEIPAPQEDDTEISSLSGITAGLAQGPVQGVLEGIPGGFGTGVVGGTGLGNFPTKPLLPVGGKLQNSKLIHRVQPQYPEPARLALIQGIVVLQVMVGREGLVSDVEIVRGHPLLNDAAIVAVRQWRYSPMLLNGQAIPTIATVTVNFVLESAPAQESC